LLCLFGPGRDIIEILFSLLYSHLDRNKDDIDIKRPMLHVTYHF
jgi:hypothetical protein